MIVALLSLLVLKERGQYVAAAGLLAFAVSFKLYPIIFIAPFATGRDTRFLLYAVAACVALLFVIPSVLLGGGDTFAFYGALGNSFRQSDWVVANPHSQYLPHVVLRLAGAAGHEVRTHLTLLKWIAYGVAAANLGLLFLIRRAHLRNTDLWSFQLVFLTLPFVLKTSWPHDFVFLSFTQAFLAWRLLGRPPGGTWRERASRTRVGVALTLLLPSIALSNIVFFNFLGDFSRYGFYGFLLWADLLLLTALYVELLPPALRRLRAIGARNRQAF
jgi:hypothetical protein